jgi:hypothetical protein
MTTIKQIEDAIVAALQDDATIGAYKGGVISADDAGDRISRKIMTYQAVVVVYTGAPEGGVIAGGTGGGGLHQAAEGGGGRDQGDDRRIPQAAG